jgi:4-amino-4-deoxy-L-arabinose transferase-like glycosyltransferase
MAPAPGRHARAPRRCAAPSTSSTGCRRRARPAIWLVALCLLLWLPGFFTIPQGDRDESRFAQATRQMVETGDYVRIRLGDVERNKKPAGIHWAQAAVVHALEAAAYPGARAIWAYRMPSLLGAHHRRCWRPAMLGRALVGRRAAFLAAAMLAPCMVLVVEAHRQDRCGAARGHHRGDGADGAGLPGAGPLHGGQAAGFWAVLGLGVLLKGPIAPLVPLLAGLTLAIMDRPARGRFWRLPPPGCRRCGRAGACR